MLQGVGPAAPWLMPAASLGDARCLTGLANTRRCIEADTETRRRLVNLIWSGIGRGRNERPSPGRHPLVAGQPGERQGCSAGVGVKTAPPSFARLGAPD
jgi:hypothetical protein